MVDITNGAEKADGVGVVLDHLGLSWSDALVIGDGSNDVSMARLAGCAVAVGEAHADLIAVATHRAEMGAEAGSSGGRAPMARRRAGAGRVPAPWGVG